MNDGRRHRQPSQSDSPARTPSAVHPTCHARSHLTCHARSLLSGRAPATVASSVMPESRETRSDSDYVSHLSGISCRLVTLACWCPDSPPLQAFKRCYGRGAGNHMGRFPHGEAGVIPHSHTTLPLAPALAIFGDDRPQFRLLILKDAPLFLEVIQRTPHCMFPLFSTIVISQVVITQIRP